jgi:hypothetical protein
MPLIYIQVRAPKIDAAEKFLGFAVSFHSAKAKLQFVILKQNSRGI